MTWTSRIPEYQSALGTALDQGVREAAEYYAQSMADELKQGYTTGKYVTGLNADSVQVYPAEIDGEDVSIDVGTPLLMAIYWELGFHHAHTGTFERQPVWLPVFEEEVDTMTAIIIEKVQEIDV